MTKVCLYTICKDEDHEVEGWWESAKEADYVIALDTGSSDGMDDHLERLGCEVHRKEYDTFRFDVARNDSMEYAYATDADVFVNLDMDERFNPGWADILREEWGKGDYERGTCSYYCENPDKPGRRNWIHNRDWHWHYPVHETLYRNGGGGIWYHVSNNLDLEGLVYIHHQRKPVKKTRDQYLSLIELRWEEDKPAQDSLCYLVREYMYANKPDKTLALIPEIEELELEGNIGSWVATFVAWAYEAVGQPHKAMAWDYRAYRMDPTCRTAPVSLARLLHADGNPDMAYEVLKEAYRTAAEWNVNCMFYDAQDVWVWRMDDWMGVVLSSLGRMEEAVSWYEKALAGAMAEDEAAVPHIRANLEYARRAIGG